MRRHQGEHARLGATDVCPFVPLDGTTMAECVALARQLGRRVGDELGIPVYLYEEAAARPERRNLATIRAGEYEGLEAKLRDPAWQPDFGPARFDAKSGATVIGAREFLVAYNINLNTRDKKRAHDIALDLREAGRAERGPDGAILRDADGKARQRPGLFPHVKAVGWYIEEYGRAQISINLTNTRVTPLHAVFDAACRAAESRGLRVTGSEIVGLVPRAVLLDAGRHYLRRQGRTAAVPESELVHVAVQTLGLHDIRPFVPDERVIEYRVRDPQATRLAALRVTDFADLVSTDSPAPGGGSVAALAGALAASLVSMVASLAPRADVESANAIEAIGLAAQELKAELLAAVDADARAFDAVLAARRLPRDSDAARAARDAAIASAMRGAVDVPLAVCAAAARAAALSRDVARVAQPATLSDAGVAALCAAAAAEGARDNVLVNLTDAGADAWAQAARQRAAASAEAAATAAREARIAVRAALGD
jgi:glutamate formiminotransferase/formiminotetrahydrofolate cyclodeaminase